jgi:Na+-transporting NADH:ubiquinone oxidoreductase subunit B
VRLLRRILDLAGKPFGPGAPLERLHPLYEATDNFLYTPGTVTKGAPHVRDAMDLKRYMVFVVLALVPTVLMALYNTGYQANRALAELGTAAVTGWRGEVLAALGLGVDPGNLLDNVVHGALYFLPVYLVTLAAGGTWEVIFACVRKHPISEGFLVTSLLFPLILPPTIPWWQVVLGISFGVVIGKEIFGGVGMNVLNVALTSRAFLYFAYPAQISGDACWVAVDGYSMATPLGALADSAVEAVVDYGDAFWGFIPGSMGETSAFACLLGAAFLIITKVGSWRIMLGTVLGMAGMAATFNAIGSDTNPLFTLTPLQHFVLGGFAFGTVYMATDPVSAAHTLKGQYLYGLLIGVMTVLVRVVNPGFPEGIMLAILFGNVFAPIIDKIFIYANVRRRLRRNAR